MEEKTLVEGFEHLEEIIEKMESREISLEESFELYKAGMEELQFCNDKIQKTEKAVMEITSSGSLRAFSEE